MFRLHTSLKLLNSVTCPTYAGQQLVPNERKNYQEFKIYCVCLAHVVLVGGNRPPFLSKSLKWSHFEFGKGKAYICLDCIQV